MAKPKIYIGIPVFGTQSHHWWLNLIKIRDFEHRRGDVEIINDIAINSAVIDHNKNDIVYSSCNPVPPGPDESDFRNSMVDSNRVAIVGGTVNKKKDFGFLKSKADYIMWIDDDTTPPTGAISHLVSLGREMVGGVYFLSNEPHNPVCYFRQANGFYTALYNYAPGTLVQVDSIGMGCTLIHRSVYERIMEGHEVFLRPTGTPLAVPKEAVQDRGRTDKKAYVQGGFYHLPLKEPEPNDERPWPFYALEYGRTEDHHFCELVANVGVPIYVDTTVKCGHLKERTVSYAHYKAGLAKQVREAGGKAVAQAARP